jgi:hypothetical protein
MSGIPLPALGIKPVEQPDLLGNYGKVLAVKQAQQGIQENQLALQQKQRQMQDQQTIMETAAAHNGNLVDALPELAGKISAASFVPLQKSIMDTQKAMADKTKIDLENDKAKGDQLLGLISQAKQLPPDQYQAAFPQIAAQAMKIEPQLKLNPQQPIPQQYLDHVALGIATQSQLAGMESEKRAQSEEARKQALAPSQLSEAQSKATVAAQDAALSPEDRKNLKASEASLALQAAQGDKTADSALKRMVEDRKASRPVNNIMTSNDAKDIADAIENGDQPPTLQGLYRNAGPVRAELARRGVPMARMETDWKATQKYVATLNGSQQTRLRQSITSASDMADKIDGLYQEYHSVVGDAGMKAFNKAGLIAAQNLPGKAGALAHALVAQISDLTADLGNVYMGGNSPTDHALELAGKNLSADWNRETFEEGLKQVHANIKIRQNSITHAAPAGLSGDSNYFQPQQGGGTQPATATQGPDFFSQFGGKAK